jgi:hypothetical protein
VFRPRPAGVEPHDGRALEDPDAALDERSPEPPREPSRVHGRGTGDPEARANDRRVEALADLVLGQRPVHVGEPQTLRLRHGLSTEASCAAFVDTPRSPDGSYQASTPASSHHVPTSSIDRAAASIVRRPPSP